ncbi:MAG TPA: M14-type cytosolic carboxypeptidase, partial [Armatimonadota bacterium]|nr:M14-type cytosolic carboxypeptidase [Armatimonadota bacterium]
MSITLDADFPGGNIIVESVDGDVVTLRQDRRDTPVWWFYWAFRARGMGGRTLTFAFTDGDVFAALGPCYSADGETWRWLGRGRVAETRFTHSFPRWQEAAYFAFCIPYTHRQLRAFLAANPAVERGVLCTSEGGRAVERLSLPSATGTRTVVLTARHHACETMANYVLEGILAFRQADEPDAAFLREHVDLHAIPFMDVDGVERGDQGKSRAPHDHNRDYTDAPRYAAVRALTAWAPAWRGDFPLMLDLHCPWIRAWRNEDVLLVEPDGVDRAAQDRFRALLHGAQTGPVRYDRRHLLRYGEDWNTAGETSTQYFRHT